MEDNKDVDTLYDDLRKELDKGSEEEESSGASAQEPQEAPADDDDAGAELSEEEIAKLSPRAQKRIREQAEQIKELAAKVEGKPETDEAPETEEKPDLQNFKNVQEFLAAVEDEPSRKLLETFYNVIKGETKAILDPIEQKNNDARFEAEFSKYEGIEGIADHKSDLKKTFMRDPSQSLKSLIGEVVTDIELAKIKAPIESAASKPNRDKIDTEGKSKEELYNILDSLRP